MSSINVEICSVEVTAFVNARLKSRLLDLKTTPTVTVEIVPYMGTETVVLTKAESYLIHVKRLRATLDDLAESLEETAKKLANLKDYTSPERKAEREVADQARVLADQARVLADQERVLAAQEQAKVREQEWKEGQARLDAIHAKMDVLGEEAKAREEKFQAENAKWAAFKAKHGPK